MAAPIVQTLEQVMADLAPGTAQQTALIEQQRAGLGAKTAATKSALGAEKTQGFNLINNQATGKGLSFSGIPIDEQATYLSTKYLPGVMQADADEKEADLGLQRQSADIFADNRKTALGIQQNQQQSLNSWNLQEAQMQAQARESALNRSASASAAKSQQLNFTPLINFFDSKRGGDKRISPASYREGLQMALNMGLSIDEYQALAEQSMVINRTHGADYIPGYVNQKNK